MPAFVPQAGAWGAINTVIVKYYLLSICYFSLLFTVRSGPTIKTRLISYHELCPLAVVVVCAGELWRLRLVIVVVQLLLDGDGPEHAPELVCTVYVSGSAMIKSPTPRHASL